MCSKISKHLSILRLNAGFQGWNSQNACQNSNWDDSELRPKKNNCVVPVTAEKTFGRVGRYFFFFCFFFLRWLSCWMTKKNAF